MHSAFQYQKLSIKLRVFLMMSKSVTQYKAIVVRLSVKSLRLGSRSVT